jgi:NADP-dependent 3-hydroxy acid dehydrogenase YdfG
MSLKGIITGAASGIGLPAAQELVDKGWVICGIDASEPPLSRASHLIPSPNFRPMPCDLRDAEAVTQIMKRIQQETT